METWKRELYSRTICHYGVSKRDGAKFGSGRYPLGSGERPRADGLTIFKPKNKRYIESRSDFDTDQEWEDRKRRAVREGDIKFVQKHKYDFSPKDLDDAMNNFDRIVKLDTKVKNLDKSNREKVMAWIKNLTKDANIALDFANVIRRFMNFIDGKTENNNQNNQNNQNNNQNKKKKNNNN